MVIGARNEFGDGHPPPHAGAAYVFVRNDTNWILQASLKAPDGSGSSRGGRVAPSSEPCSRAGEA